MRKELIAARGEVSQSQVARDIGISQQYLSKIESGERNPGFRIACTISAYYNLPINYLFPDIFLKTSTPKCSKKDKTT